MRQSRNGPDLVARCEGNEYLLLAATERGAAFLKRAPSVFRRRDGGVAIGDEIDPLFLAGLAANGLTLRRIEQ